MAVRLGPELRRTAAEYLAFRKKVGMDLKAHYPFVITIIHGTPL
jgi:hypothetical protein